MINHVIALRTGIAKSAAKKAFGVMPESWDFIHRCMLAGAAGGAASSFHWLPALLSGFAPIPVRLLAVVFGAVVELKTRKAVDGALREAGLDFGYEYYLRVQREATQSSEAN